MRSWSLRQHGGRTLVGFIIGASLACPLWAQEPDFAAPGRKLFIEGVTGQVNCALCHTLQHAGTTGSVGPSLDELMPDAERVRSAVREGIGAMPAFTWLSDEQVDLLARYVAWASKPR